MEKYDLLSVVGEGSYGLVMRCRHRETGQHVAIKKFLETDDDLTVKKMAMREIRMLRKLRHENLVNLIDVFRRKKRFFLVFEYVEHTVLEELEAHAGGLGFVVSRKHIYQVLRALDFIHSNNVIHRDIKPENVLVSRLGVVKLCDFGFARHYDENETFTDYVATRWYRSPELLVGDTRYGKEVDIWAVGCLYAEMMTGEPLFPGESDIDQLFQIVRVLGKPNCRHQLLITRNAMFKGMKQEQNSSLVQLFPDWNRDSLDFVTQCLRMDTNARPDTASLLKHELFVRDDFLEYFTPELKAKIHQEVQSNPLLKRMQNIEGANTGVRKKSSGRQEERKQLEKQSSAALKRNPVDDTKQSKNKEKITQIGLTLPPQNQPQVTLNNLYNHSQSSNIKETQSMLRSSFSHSNENLNNTNGNTNNFQSNGNTHANTTTHAHANGNAHANGHAHANGNAHTNGGSLTKKQIISNVNSIKSNLFNYSHGVADQFEKTPRILSAQKSQKASLNKTNLYTYNLLQETQFSNTSPAKFQSLQSTDSNGNNDHNKHNSHMSPSNGLSVSGSFLHYFNSRSRQLPDTKASNKTSPIELKITSNKSTLPRRERGLPHGLGNGSLITNANYEAAKDSDLRLLQPPPWLTSSHAKISSNEKVAHLNSKRMTDWKTMHNEINRLTGIEGENILLPLCPGASLSPTKAGTTTTASTTSNIRKKLTPMINSPEFHPPSLSN